MADGPGSASGKVDRLPGSPQSTVVSDELNRILTLLRERCPDEADISFDFDGRLHVHIDVRKLEDVVVIEALLPTLGFELFHDITRGDTPHHPFLHRVSALVAR